MHSLFRWVILAVISSALLLVAIDMTVLYTALPRLTQDLEASAVQKLWIVNAYPLTMAGLLISMGVLNDRYGAKCFLNIGLLIFGIASVAAAFSVTPEMLIASRALLAVGAAAIMPATMVIVRKVFADPAERSLAIGIWSAVASGGSALGPVLGGLLLEYFWWGSVFLINVPIIVIAFLFSLKLIPPIAGNKSRVLNIAAALQILTGMTALIFAMKELSKSSPQLSIAILSGVSGVIMTGLFVRNQLRSASPMLDLTLFGNRYFTTGIIAAMISVACVIGVELAITQRLQLIILLSPFTAGLFILPLPLAAFCAGPIVGWLVPFIGSFRAIVFSMLVSATGLGLYLVVFDNAIWMSVVALAMTGAGLGGAMTAASAAVILNSPEHSSGAAASLESVAFEFGGTIGITLLGGLLNVIYSYDISSVPDLPFWARDSIDGAIAASKSLNAEEGQILLSFAESAFMSGFVALLGASIFMLLFTCAVLGLCKRKFSR
ncbi:MFS transporter [Pantoea stewartii]|uniref:MFS transporter n=1 Tax=Pantoea stewartii TaxID=66269 RepID=UPI000736F40D|nr:MFS transporter [Pantoea stewartii]KTS25533.1 MFS transporter [Pantoea stewartii]